MSAKKQRKRTTAAKESTVSPSTCGARRFVSLVIAAAAALAAVTAAVVAGYTFLTSPVSPERTGPPDPSLSGDVQPSPSPRRQVHFEGAAYGDQPSAEELKQEALRVADALVCQHADSPTALAVAANLQERLGDFWAAAELWEQCVRLDRSYANGHFRLGKIARDRGDYESAAKHFDRVTELAPDNLEAVALLGECLLQSGHVERAVQVLEEHVRGGRALDKTLLNLGQGYMQLQRYEEARQTFARLVAEDPSETRGYYGLARACMRLGEINDAQKYLGEFRERAQVDYAQHREELLDYEDAETLRDILSQTLTLCGDVERGFGAMDRAEEMWCRAAVVAPQAPLPRAALLQLYEVQGRDADAFSVCDELCKLQPENANRWFSRGVLQARLGHKQQALRSLERAIQLQPSNADFQRVYEMIQREG